MKKVLVTGASGFIGKNLYEKLSKSKSLNVHCYKRGSDSEDKIISNLDNDYDIIIHLASYLTSDDRSESLERIINSNIRFGAKLLQKNLLNKKGLFIDTGSFAELWKPDENLAYVYASSKIAFIEFLKYYSVKFDHRFCRVIPYTVYGGISRGKKAIDFIIDSINSSTPVKMSPGEQELDYIHVSDVISLYESIVDSYDNPVLNNLYFECGTSSTISLKKISNAIEEITGKKCNITWGAQDYRPRDIMYAKADISLAKEVLNWQPEYKIHEYLKNELL